MVTYLARTAALSAVLAMLSPRVGSAQAAIPTPPAPAAPGFAVPGTPEFARMVQDKKVVVTLRDGVELKGKVVAVTSTEIVFPASGFGTCPAGVQRANGCGVSFDRISKVKRAALTFGQGALIGWGGGIVAHASVVAVKKKPTDVSVDKYGAWAVLQAVGLGIGIVVAGALNDNQKNLIYDRSYMRHTTTVAVAPLLSSTRKGLVVSLTWR